MTFAVMWSESAVLWQNSEIERERKKNDNIKTETVISVFRVWTEHIHRSTLLFVYKILLLLNIQIYATFLCIIIMPEPARWRTRSTLVIKSWRGQKWIVARQRCTSTHYEMLNKIRSTEAHYNTTTTSSAEQQQQQQNRRKIYNIHMRMITKQAPQITQYDGMEIVISILINKSGQIWQRAYTTTTIGVETYNNSNNKSKQRRREIKKKNVTDQLLDVGAVKVHRDVVDVCGACVNVLHERQSVALAAEAIER